jgi:hypothetical protein
MLHCTVDRKPGFRAGNRISTCTSAAASQPTSIAWSA